MFHLADFEPFLRSTVNKSPVILLTDKLDESFHLWPIVHFSVPLLKSSSPPSKVSHPGFLFFARYHHRLIEPCSQDILKLQVWIIGPIFFNYLTTF